MRSQFRRLLLKMRTSGLRPRLSSIVRRYAIYVLVFIGVASIQVRADTYVISNRQGDVIRFYVPALTNAEAARMFELGAGQSMAIPGLGAMAIQYESEVGPIRSRLQPNAVYTFDVTSDSRLLLNQLDLGSDESTAAGTGRVNFDRIQPVVEIPVKILVDDDEPAQRAQWEDRLRKRVAAASQVLEACCRVRLQVTEVGTWLSDNRLGKFEDAFQEFTRGAALEPARLSIGFTSQFPVPDRPGRVGLSSGLLRGHILMREGSRRATESEMAEALLQEIARTFGAVNQDVDYSIMRPQLLDGQARRKEFELQFDPVNLLLVNMLAEEIRRNKVQQLADLQPGTRARLKQIYTRLGLAPKAKPEPEVATVPRAARAPLAAEPVDEEDTPRKRSRKRVAPHPDLGKFQGDWKVVSAQRKGELVPEAMLYKPTLKDDKLTLAADNLGEFRFRMDIDPDSETDGIANEPAETSNFIPFNLVMKVQGKDFVALGIYQFDGGRLKVCIARPGKPRPTKFISPADVDQALLVFKRPDE